MSNIFFTSDTHFGHANIAGQSSSNWKSGFRDYSSLHEMNKDLTNNINKTVGYDDTLYHLGDWSFGGIENIWKFRKQIHCQNIHLILGNHDHHIENNAILPNVISSVPYGAYDTYTDGEPEEIGDTKESYPHYVEAQSLFKSVQHYKEIKINGRIYVLCHYAFRVWHGSHKGWINLYGHSHDALDFNGKETPYGKSMDVSVDSAYRILGARRPFSVTEIDNLLINRPIQFVDHHDPNTNTGRIGGKKR